LDVASDSDAPNRIFELEDVPDSPGTYFNPKTEVLVVVDDSATIDQDVFQSGAYRRAPWVKVSDEVPVDESGRDELLEKFETDFHPGATGAPTLDDEDIEEDIDEDHDKGDLDGEEDDFEDEDDEDDGAGLDLDELDEE
jgi:hypothetical protein